MVSLTDVLASNANLKSFPSGLVGVFVGGNSGIGASALKAFVKHSIKPRVYILARNEISANEVLEEARLINPSMQGSFIKVDASLLSSVTTACETIKQREKYINLLIFTCGGFSFTGRIETTEGIDRKLALNFYSRMQFTRLLSPLLASGRSSHNLASCVSLLGAGREAAITETDLSLEKPGAYTLKTQFAHSIVLTDLLFERWATSLADSTISFVHQFPGYVPTKQVTGLGLEGWWTPLRWILRGIEFLALPLSIGIEESGERTLFSAVSERYPAKAMTNGSGGDEAEVAVGSDGVTRGTGAYILHWNGESVGNQNVLRPLREKGFDKVVEEHFNEMVDKALKSKQ